MTTIEITLTIPGTPDSLTDAPAHLAQPIRESIAESWGGGGDLDIDVYAQGGDAVHVEARGWSADQDLDESDLAGARWIAERILGKWMRDLYQAGDAIAAEQDADAWEAAERERRAALDAEAAASARRALDADAAELGDVPPSWLP